MPPRLSPALPVRLRRVSELDPCEVAWLWAGRLALGKPAILEGDPGLGKSYLTLDLCARLSTGAAFPDGSPSPGPANAIILNGEDGPADTIRPRLQALGADTDRVYIVEAGEKADQVLCLPTHTKELESVLQEARPKLLVIDPLVAFLDRRVNIGNDANVRQALLPLAVLAERYACAVLLNRHLTKRGGTHSLYRGAGSIGFVGACRSAWLVARDPEDPVRRVLAQVKNNLGPPQPSLAFTLTTPAEGGLPSFSWLGPSPWSADQLVANRPDGERSLPRTNAREFLETALRDGPRTSRDIWELAEREEISERTLERAKKELEIRSERVWADGQRLSYWLLPNQKLTEQQNPYDLEPWLAPLRKDYPHATPLDEL